MFTYTYLHLLITPAPIDLHQILCISVLATATSHRSTLDAAVSSVVNQPVRRIEYFKLLPNHYADPHQTWHLYARIDQR